MTHFRYQAVDRTGAIRRGTLASNSLADAKEELRARDLLPVSLKPSIFVAELGQFNLRFGAKTAKPADVAIFTRQMATLISNEVQVEAALTAVAEQSGSRLAALCRDVRHAVLDGSTLSNALAHKSKRFDRFYLTSVRAGEVSGKLGAVFTHLADHLEHSQRNRQTISLALIYPAILIAVSICVVMALLVFVLPDIVRVFASRGADLPGLTKAMISLSEFLSRYGLLLLGLAAAMAAIATISLRREENRRRWHRLVWRIGLAKQIILVQFTGTLATLTQSGVTLTDALHAATGTVENLEAKAVFSTVTNDVKEGRALSNALSTQAGIPKLMITMIASGEASGSLPAMIGRFWEDQTQSLQARIKALVGLVEPLVLLGMGGVVMLLVLAILMPIINLNSLVG